MKAYRSLPILECHEPLAHIPPEQFSLWDPHPYLAEGADYGGISPWQLRVSVLDALIQAQSLLPEGLRLVIFDAYRPVPVQSHMVLKAFMNLSGGRPPNLVPESERKRWLEKTYRIWAEPSDSPLSPPPHSTGAAVDLTLGNSEGHPIDMGSPIDENSERSLPDHFLNKDPLIHQNRACLLGVMEAAGFRRHAEEWWHFSLWDQMWCFTRARETGTPPEMARYGRADRIASAGGG